MTYLITSCTHSGVLVDEMSTQMSQAEQDPYRNVFEAIAFEVPFRPEPPAFVGAPVLQTGQIVAPEGEEIDTDVMGRVQVQFHWAHADKDAPPAVAWLRVSQMLAGVHSSFMAVPRVGAEVLIGFVNGHIDHPVVVGSLCNDANPQVYDPQRHKSRTTLRTYTTPYTGGYNELTFEDAQDKQCIALHAENDYSTRVKGRHIDLVAGEVGFKPFGSKNVPAGQLPVKVDDLVPAWLVHPDHEPAQGPIERRVDATGNTIVDALHTAADKASTPQTRAPFAWYKRATEFRLDGTREGHDPLLPNEHLYALLGKLAMQAISHHYRDKDAKKASDFFRKVAARNKANKALVAYTQSAAPKATPMVKKLQSGLWGCFEFASKYEERTRQAFEQAFAAAFGFGKVAGAQPSSTSAPSATTLVSTWFASLFTPGASKMWKRLSFTEGGALCITTKDHRAITLRKRIAHVGAESTDVVYGERYVQTSGALKEVTLGDAQSLFGGDVAHDVAGHATRRVAKNTTHEGLGAWMAQYQGNVAIASQKGSVSIDAKTNLEQTSGQDLVVRAARNSIHTCDNAHTTRAKTLVLDAHEELTIVQGQTILTLKDGHLVVKSADVRFEVDHFEVKAKKGVRIDGPKIDIGG